MVASIVENRGKRANAAGRWPVEFLMRRKKSSNAKLLEVSSDPAAKQFASSNFGRQIPIDLRRLLSLAPENILNGRS